MGLNEFIKSQREQQMRLKRTNATKRLAKITAKLTNTEIEIISTWIHSPSSIPRLADKVLRGLRTVQFHLDNIRIKTGTSSTPEAAHVLQLKPGDSVNVQGKSNKRFLIVSKQVIYGVVSATNPGNTGEMEFVNESNIIPIDTNQRKVKAALEVLRTKNES